MITIICVVLNQADELNQTIQSVKSLNRKVELIVVDGKSNDGTLDIIKGHDDFINSWISEKDNGIYDAFNKGWNMASENSHVLYLGAGDKILKLPKESVLRFSDVLYGNVILEGRYTFISKADFRLKLGNTLHHQALLVKKSLLKASPFDTNFKTYADFDLNQRLLKSGAVFSSCPNLLASAIPDGVSHHFNWKESLSVVRHNYGIYLTGLAFCYYVFQFLIEKINMNN
ncbi:Glycosyltransferase involved in cell wall bisynthesis [Reichenbachiella agariperforans]|uniref:Glycosyltransferase involved in cell wall bisynthesis n=1 Tax=Reichenbachiella agariperforans TaxID=156994 RepID=A0A1M6NUG7_REIAG|nr:glycosyltransferase [Reichenbachiella agariperforans]SHJ99355.1 Glycosyltransferase involved in cell wall bisynthesis [Reichenbachiella agariperforans]